MVENNFKEQKKVRFWLIVARTAIQEAKKESDDKLLFKMQAELDGHIEILTKHK